MTNDDAIEILQLIRLGKHITNDEALEMAIQALSQEPCDDAVSREAVLGNLCNSCTNIGCEFQSGIVRTKCAFYMPPRIESDNCGNYVVMQPTAEANNALNMCDDVISLADAKEIIARNDSTNGKIAVFTGKQVQQMLDTLPRILTKPIECEDAISRDAVLEIICRETEWYDIRTQINELPSVTQKSTLEQIRDEIESLPRELPTDARNMVRRTRVLDIIDRHMKGADT